MAPADKPKTKPEPTHPHRVEFVPQVSLGSVVSVLSIIGFAIGLANSVGDVRATVSSNTTRISTLEQSAQQKRLDDAQQRAELLVQMRRIEDKLDQIRGFQTTRQPTPGQ